MSHVMSQDVVDGSWMSHDVMDESCDVTGCRGWVM